MYRDIALYNEVSNVISCMHVDSLSEEDIILIEQQAGGCQYSYGF